MKTNPQKRTEILKEYSKHSKTNRKSLSELTDFERWLIEKLIKTK